MVEADSHLKLLITFILNMYKVVEHIDMKLPPRRGGSSLLAVGWRCGNGGGGGGSGGSLAAAAESLPVAPSPSSSTTARRLRIGNSKVAIATRATTPLQRWQRCLRIGNNDTITTRATTPAQRRQDACTLSTLANLANHCCGQAHGK